MKRVFAITLTLPLLLAALPKADANEAPPPPPRPAAPALIAGPQKAKLVVEIDDKAKEPRLQIPQNLLLAAPAPAPKPGQAALGLPTLVIGLALSAAFVSGGFWFLRRGRGRHVAALFLALSLVAAGGTGLWANAPFIPPPQKPITLLLPTGVTLQEDITIEVVEKGDTVKFIITKDMPIGGKEKPEEKKSEK